MLTSVRKFRLISVARGLFNGELIADSEDELQKHCEKALQVCPVELDWDGHGIDALVRDTAGRMVGTLVRQED